jgi:hypothetical protein
MLRRLHWQFNLPCIPMTVLRDCTKASLRFHNTNTLYLQRTYVLHITPLESKNIPQSYIQSIARMKEIVLVLEHESDIGLIDLRPLKWLVLL